MFYFLKRLSFAAFLGFLGLWITSFVVVHWPGIAVKAGYNKRWVIVSKRLAASSNALKSDTLYIGDSVAGQLFPFNNDNQLTTNGSVLVLGNYILASNAIKKNPHLKTLVYLTVPQVIGLPFEKKETCNNFVKPFFRFDNFQYFDKTLYDKLKKKPLSFLYCLPFVKVLPFSEANFEAGEPPISEYQLSEFSMQYLSKLKTICEENQVQLILASPPIPTSLCEKSNDWAVMRQQVAGTGLSDMFDHYFSSIQYVDDQNLKDHVHWKDEFLKINRAELIENMFN